MRFDRMLLMPSAVLLLGGAALGALSQAKSPAKPAAQTPQKTEPKKAESKSRKPVPWNIQFETMERSENTGESDFTGVVAVSDEGTTMHADHWHLNEKTKTAVATGNLKMTDPQADATGKQADIDYNKGKRILVLTGNVEILVKPKKDKNAPAPPAPAEVKVADGKATVQDPNAPKAEDENAPGSARKHPATITCDRLEYEYAKDKKHATLTGSFKVVQKLSDRTRTLTADHAEWFGLEDRILLHPPVHVEETKGLQSFDTNEPVTVFTTEGNERMSVKRGSGVYEVQDEDTEEDKPRPGTKK